MKWMIPNSRKSDCILPTYGFPRSKPRLWIATTQFPRTRTTRDAFLLAVSAVAPISIAFEFNVGRQSSSHLSFRFQEGVDDDVVVRFKCAFTIEGRRRRSSCFFDYVSREGIGLKTETIGGREFVRLFDLPLKEGHRASPRICEEFEKFARVVVAYKDACKKGDLSDEGC